jgi:hypothetical protein
MDHWTETFGRVRLLDLWHSFSISVDVDTWSNIEIIDFDKIYTPGILGRSRYIMSMPNDLKGLNHVYSGPVDFCKYYLISMWLLLGLE